MELNSRLGLVVDMTQSVVLGLVAILNQSVALGLVAILIPEVLAGWVVDFVWLPELAASEGCFADFG